MSTNKLLVGDKLDNGGTVLQYDEDAQVVLAIYNGEFVTWRCTDATDTVWGHYHQQDIAAALTEYCNRVAEGVQRIRDWRVAR